MIHVKFMAALVVVLGLMFGVYTAGMAYLPDATVMLFKVVVGLQLFGIVWFVTHWVIFWAQAPRLTGKLA